MTLRCCHLDACHQFMSNWRGIMTKLRHIQPISDGVHSSAVMNLYKLCIYQQSTKKPRDCFVQHKDHNQSFTLHCFSISGQLNIRVTDSALSRDIFVHDYHCLGDNENRPVKWLALEALVERKFSPASDVVSFLLLRPSMVHYKHVHCQFS